MTTHTPLDTDVDNEVVIYALHGIFTALDWIDEGFLDEKLYAEQIKTARPRLLSAGLILCERTFERF